MKLTNLNLAEILASSLSSISEIDTGIALSPEQFKFAIIKKMESHSLVNHLNPGHCVVLLKNNSIEFFIDFLALYFLGVTVIPLDESQHADDIERVVLFSRANLIIDSTGTHKRYTESQSELVGMAIVLFTSGTTGTPKGVLISKKALVLKLETLQQQISSAEIKNSLCFLPTFFGHGLICNSLFPLFYAENFYIAQKMTIEFAGNFSHFISDKNITFFSSVPGHWEFILGFSDEIKNDSLKRVHCASAPLKKEKIKHILSWLKLVSFYDVYGATEMLGWFACRKIESPTEDSVFDQFWNCEHKFSNERELLIKSPYMFSGYWREKVSTLDGFFETGDLFEAHKLVGRSKNIINKNGIKINTDELNSAYLRSNILVDVATFPIDDAYKGEDIGVFIVLKKDKTIEAFRKYCNDHLSILHYPSRIIPTESIPKNSRNKTSLALLKKIFMDIV